MSKFYQYISEEYGKSRVEPISESDAKDSIRYNCKKSAESTPIWRGTESFNQNYGFGDSANVEQLRRSANTKNYYTLIIDNSNPWKNFPDRSKSFVCITNNEEAERYEVSYRVIPFNGTPIGVCSDSDMWDSFKFINNLSDLNDMLYMAGDYLNLNVDKMDNDYRYLIKSINKIGQNIREKDGSPPWIKFRIGFSIQTLVRKFLETDKKLSDFIIDLMSPRNNKFKLVKAGNKIPEDREIWFSGKAIFIRSSELNSILDKYKSIEKWANDVKNNRYIEDMVT